MFEKIDLAIVVIFIFVLIVLLLISVIPIFGQAVAWILVLYFAAIKLYNFMAE